MDAKSTQIEDGFTRIPNELLGAMIAFDLSKREQKIMLFVIRKTYGFGKYKDDMTLTQIANATGLDLGHVSKSVKEMTAKKILLKQQGRYGFILSVNRNYGQWTTLPKQQGITKTASEPCQNSNLTLPIQQPQKKLPKETTNRDVRFDEFWLAYPKKVDKTKAQKSFVKVNPDEDLFQVIMRAVSTQKLTESWQKNEGQFIPNPTTWLNGRRWEDEVRIQASAKRGLVN